MDAKTAARMKARIARMTQAAKDLTQVLGLPREATYEILAMMYGEPALTYGVLQQITQQALTQRDVSEDIALKTRIYQLCDEFIQTQMKEYLATFRQFWGELQEFSKISLDTLVDLGVSEQKGVVDQVLGFAERQVLRPIIKVISETVVSWPTLVQTNSREQMIEVIADEAMERGCQPELSFALAYYLQSQLTKESHGLLFVLLGITGNENDMVIAKLKETGINIFVSPIFTTRKVPERQGSPHYFINEEDFRHYMANDMLLTYVENKYRKNLPTAWYGHLRALVMESLRRGQDVLMQATPEEAVMLHDKKQDAILIHLIPPHEVRDEEEHERWESRLQQIENHHTIRFDSYREIQKAVDDLKDIIEKYKRKRANEEQVGRETAEEQTSSKGTDSGVIT